MGTHKHHIIPKHAGGTDDPDNLIELTVDEHAEAHRKLYEEHGRWQDFMAWKALSGQIGKDEIRKLRAKLSAKPLTPEQLQQLRTMRLGTKHSEKTKAKMSKTRKGKKLNWDLNNTTPEANEKRSQTMRGKSKPVLQCPHCGKEGGAPQMKQWHFDNCKEKS